MLRFGYVCLCLERAGIVIVFLMSGLLYFASERAYCTQKGILAPFHGFGGRLPKTPMHGHQGKGVQGPGREGGGSVPGSCRGWGSPFFKPPLPFAFQAPADREQQSEGQGFLPQLHPAPEGCGEAQDQQRYGNRSLLSGGPCPMLGDCGLVKKRSPQGCSEELPPFPVTEGHPGKLLKRREGLPLPVLPSWGSRQQDVEKKPSVM